MTRIYRNYSLKKILITTRSYLVWERDDEVLRVRSADGGAELSCLTIWVIITFCQVWWCTPLIPELRRQRQVDLCKTELGLVYTASPRTVRGRYIESPCL